MRVFEPPPFVRDINEEHEMLEPLLKQKENPLPRVAIVIVHYQAVEPLLHLLKSLESLDYKNYYIHIIDHSPEAGLRSFITDIELTSSPENGGFAQGCNIGIRHAMGVGAQYVWLLNPDTSVSPSALCELVDSMEEGVAAVGSKVLDNDSNSVWSLGGKIEKQDRSLAMIGHGEEHISAPENPDYLPGCSILLSMKAIESVGPLPEDYFMYFEETEWCARVSEKGFRLKVAPKSVVRHHFEAEKMQRPFTVYYYNRNKHHFWSTQLRGISRLRYTCSVFFRELPRAIYAYFCAPTPEHKLLFKAHTFAALDFLRGRRGRGLF